MFDAVFSRARTLTVATAVGLMLIAAPAFAGNWGEPWGTLVWGVAVPAPKQIPALPLLAAVVMGAAITALVLRLRRSGRSR